LQDLESAEDSPTKATATNAVELLEQIRLEQLRLEQFHDKIRDSHF
jgi:hypothetical protein